MGVPVEIITQQKWACYKTRNGNGNEMALGSFYRLQLLLYWLTLKDGSEDWLVEPGPYYIRPHTIILPEQTIKYSNRTVTAVVCVCIKEQCL